MFEKLANGIPLNEAAAFFIKLRTFDKTAEGYAPPDETGELEGQFAAPVERVLEHMGVMVQNELKTNFAYMVYANSLRDFAHHAIAQEFESHAHDETDHADWLLRRMGVLGGPIHVPDIPAPAASSDATDIIQTMIRMEQEGIQNWRVLLQLVGDTNPMKFKIEEYLTAEQEHLDELWQLLPQQASQAVLRQSAGAPQATVEMPQAPPSAPDTAMPPPDQKTASAEKVAKPTSMTPASGPARVLELLTGSHHKALTDAVDHHKVRERALKGAEDGVWDKFKNAPSQIPAMDNFRHINDLKLQVFRRKHELLSRADAEQTAVTGSRNLAKGVAAAGAVVGAGYLGKNLLQKWKKNKDEKGKEKSSEMASLPPSAMGQQNVSAPTAPLSGGATGQHAKMAAKDPGGCHDTAEEHRAQAAVGRHRSMANLASGFNTEKHLRGERLGDVGGRLAGAVGGGLLGRHLGSKGGAGTEMAGTLGGAFIGQHLGGKAGRLAGAIHDEKSFEKKYSSAFKCAFEELSGSSGAPALGGGAGEDMPEAATGEGMDPTLMQYMQQEQEGMAQEKSQEEAFYKQKFEQASQALQAAQQQQQASEQQMQQLQQQADQTGELQQQAMQQAQQIQQAAVQNSQAAHTAATQAMQQSLQAQKDSIQQAQMAVQMRDSVHAMRQQMLQMVQQELPPATPAEANAMQVDQMAAQMGMDQGGMPQDNTQQAPGAEGEVPDPNQAGQPAAQPDAGTPPAAATPGDGSGAGTSPSAGAGAQPTMQNAQPQAEQGQAQEPQKVGAASHDALIGAIMGGSAGAGLGMMAAHGSKDPLRDKVQKLQEREQSGQGGFFNALNLAQAKARLAVGEVEEKHPHAMMAALTLGGAAMGAGMSPLARKGIRPSEGG